MTYGVSVLFSIAVCIFAQYECEIICFSCTGLSEGEKCHNAISCAENEICFTQKYRTKDNITKYDVGCSYPELCRKDSTGVIFGKLMVDHGHVVCHQCCQDNVCNSVLTCNDNYKVPSLSCLSCSGVMSTDQCNNTIACTKNEVCFTQKYRTALNQQYYDLGCKSSTICMNGFFSNIFGRRSDSERHLLCESCCGGSSNCNRDLLCSHHNQTSINGSCTSTSGCTSNLICLSGKCTCPTNDYYWSTNTCTLLKGNNHACATSNECRKPFHCLNNSCKCPANQYWDGSLCNSRKTHNSTCTMSDECIETLFCIHGACKCDRIDYWMGNKCSARKEAKLNCTETKECKDTLQCVDDKCVCNEGDDWFWNGRICRHRKTHNSTCTMSDECIETLFCIHGACKCDRIDYWMGNKCSARKEAKLNCTETKECKDTLQCVDDKCVCNEGDDWFWNGRICRHRNTLGHFCLSHNDCKASLICNDNTCTCNNTELWNGVSCSVSRPMECYDIPFKANGVYVIYPTDRIHPKPVYCVLQDGIKWTVIQRRFNGSVNFTRNWTSYKSGFGNVNGEYWLGNEYIHLISSNGRHKIRFQLWKANGTNKYADYSTFSIGNEANKYLLTVNGYSGTAGDSLINVGSQGKAAGKRFSTFDSDNDPDSRNCAALVHGGWWYSMCEYADLNQLYRRMFWVYNIGHVNKSIMMISRET